DDLIATYARLGEERDLDVFMGGPGVSFRTQGQPAVDHGAGANIDVPGRAALAGSLTAGGAAEVFVYWGRADGGADGAEWEHGVDLGTRQPGPFVTSVSNLLYGIPYYYRAFVSNDVGVAWAPSSIVFKVDAIPILKRPGLRVREFEGTFGQGMLNPISVLAAGPETGRSIQTDPIRYENDFGSHFHSIGDNQDFALLWEGYFVPDAGPGVYSFGVAYDERVALAIDLNRDGDFDDGLQYDAGELIVDGGAVVGGCCGVRTNAVNLLDRPYRMVIGYEQADGGNRIDARWNAGTATSFSNMHSIGGTSGSIFVDEEPFEVVTEFPIHLLDTSATLRGHLIETGSVFSVELFWGSSDGETNALAWANRISFGIFTNASGVAFTQSVAGLLPATTYYARFRATNCVATLWSTSSVAFTTMGALDVDHGVGARPSGMGRMQLNGNLVAGGRAEGTFYWGTTDGGTDKAAWDSARPAGPVSQGPFSLIASNLLYGVRYYYRPYVTNAVGQQWASHSVSFKTRAPIPVPSDLDGLSLWLNASTIPSNDNDIIDVWPDDSGHGRDMQNRYGSGNDPQLITNGLNRRPVMHYDADDHHFTSYSFKDLGAYTIFTVARYVRTLPASISQRVISSVGNNWLFGFHSRQDERWYANDWVYLAGLANTNWHLHVGFMNDEPDPAATFW
ncbi:MAG: hypothetical protein AAF492_13110, partial [Verrucomicrobiota bacterium]